MTLILYLAKLIEVGHSNVYEWLYLALTSDVEWSQYCWVRAYKSLYLSSNFQFDQPSQVFDHYIRVALISEAVDQMVLQANLQSLQSLEFIEIFSTVIAVLIHEKHCALENFDDSESERQVVLWKNHEWNFLYWLWILWFSNVQDCLLKMTVL